MVVLNNGPLARIYLNRTSGQVDTWATFSFRNRDNVRHVTADDGQILLIERLNINYIYIIPIFKLLCHDKPKNP
jgi:hypothetical protein